MKYNVDSCISNAKLKEIILQYGLPYDWIDCILNRTKRIEGLDIGFRDFASTATGRYTIRALFSRRDMLLNIYEYNSNVLNKTNAVYSIPVVYCKKKEALVV